MKKENVKVLGIESSCDETAVSIVEVNKSDKGKILSNIVFSQIDEHSPFGGVVPEIASRSHVETLSPLIDQALEESCLKIDEIDGVAATSGPGLIGGLIVGLTTAKGIALGLNIPLIGVNHLEGHALTPILTNNILPPYILLLVSGGHTQLIMVKSIGQYSQIGTTIDDAAGEAFDKAAKFLDIGYPGGPALENLAKKGNNKKYNFPRPLQNSNECNFSFSGLKTSLIREAKKIEPINDRTLADLAASYQEAIIDCIKIKSEKAIRKILRENQNTEIQYFVASGGVASNKAIRDSLTDLANKHEMKFIAPPMKFCTDNAAMIAWVGGLRLLRGQKDELNIPARARWSLEEMRI
tara:strand:- start:1057 stop:2115 length:1059 start_codon:yes stop_codon:yes gene_type:complete